MVIVAEPSPSRGVFSRSLPLLLVALRGAEARRVAAVKLGGGRAVPVRSAPSVLFKGLPVREWLGAMRADKAP